MRNPLLLTCSLALLLANSGCQSLSASPPARLLQPESIKAPALAQWIRDAQSASISTVELQQILNGCGRPGTTPSPGCTAASSPTTR